MMTMMMIYVSSLSGCLEEEVMGRMTKTRMMMKRTKMRMMMKRTKMMKKRMMIWYFEPQV